MIVELLLRFLIAMTGPFGITMEPVKLKQAKPKDHVLRFACRPLVRRCINPLGPEQAPAT